MDLTHFSGFFYFGPWWAGRGIMAKKSKESCTNVQPEPTANNHSENPDKPVYQPLREKGEERIESIKKHLHDLQNAANHLLALRDFCEDAEIKHFGLSLDHIDYFFGVMDMASDTISAELGLLKYEGRPRAEAFIRKPNAGQEGFELDPIVRQNIIKDVEKLAGMSPELRLMAEGICEDLGLPLPEVIKEKIARGKAARNAGQEAA
jgi:hypothetical protein